MVSRGHQIDMGQEVKGDRRTCETDKHVVQHSARSSAEGTVEGQDDPKKGLTITQEYNALTDVMFVDLQPLQEGSNVTVIDIGKEIGFAGQVQVRVDVQRQIFYGLTIQNYSGFKRRLLWRYRMWSIQAALRFLIDTLRAGLNLDRRSHGHALPC